MVRISKPGCCRISRTIKTPESAGQCLYKYSTTVVATESLIPETKTLGRGSINQSFIRPRTAGGKSFAITISTAAPKHCIHIVTNLGQQIHLNDTLAKPGSDLILIVETSQIPCQCKRQLTSSSPSAVGCRAGGGKDEDSGGATRCPARRFGGFLLHRGCAGALSCTASYVPSTGRHCVPRS